MEVNRLNFKEVLPLVSKAIKESDFVAIDAEFTGLTSTRDPSNYDTLPTFYKKKVKGSGDFIILQLGLAIFKYDPENKRYNNACFNFYIFPFPISGVVRNVTFKCQSESLSFLANSGFDFNKVFHHGIPYVSRTEEECYRRQLQDKRKKRLEAIGSDLEYSPMKQISKDDENDITEICERVTEFLKTAKQDDELELGKFNSYKRRLIHQNIGIKFHGHVVFEVKVAAGDPNSALQPVVAYIRGDKEQQLKREDERILEEEAQLENAIGISSIIQQISESGKLIVGHNMFLDLLHITNSFIQKLPSDYYSFKDLVSVTFPKIIDTKYMASCEPLQDKVKCSVLNEMVHVFPIPDLGITEGCKGYCVADDKCHEAAYDAFLTGVCFLSMLKHLDPDFSHLTEHLIPYINRIFIYKLADIPFMNMGGTDVKPNRDHVIYISFPIEWKTKDIETFFENFGKVTVSWLDDSSAYVVFHNSQTANKALKHLGKSTVCKMMSFLKYESLVNSVARKVPLRDSERIRPSQKHLKSEASQSLLRNTSASDGDDESDEYIPEGHHFNFIGSSNGLVGFKYNQQNVVFFIVSLVIVVYIAIMLN